MPWQPQHPRVSQGGTPPRPWLWGLRHRCSLAATAPHSHFRGGRLGALIALAAQSPTALLIQ